MELLSFYFNLEQLKDRTIKQALSKILCLTIIPEFLPNFKIKLRDSLHDTFKSLIYMVFLDPHQNI